MPKFTYSASKGIEQSSGSGFVINDVSIEEEITDVADGDDCATYGVNVLAGNANLAVGTTKGQKVTIIFDAHPKAVTLTLLGGGDLSSTAAGSTAVLLWNGSAWAQVSA